MTIYRLLLLRFAGHWRRFALFAAGLAATAGAAGFVGARLIAPGGLEPFHIIIVNEDDASIESRVFLNSLTGGRYADLLDFAFADGDEAAAKLADGAATAVFTIPRGFARDVMSGVNPPFGVSLNAASPFRAALARRFAEAFAELLAASQAGVYTALDYAGAQGDAALYQQTFRDVNARFITLTLKRGDVYQTIALPAVDEPSAVEHYALHAWILLASLSSALFADLLRGTVADNARRLRAAGRGAVYAAFASAAAVFTVLLVINGVVEVFMARLGLAAFSLVGLAALSACLAAFAVCAAFLFRSGFAACFWVTVSQLAALFLAGGVIPMAFLPPVFERAGRFTLNYHAVRLLGGQGGLLPIIGFFCLFMLIAVVSLRVRGRTARRL